MESPALPHLPNVSQLLQPWPISQAMSHDAAKKIGVDEIVTCVLVEKKQSAGFLAGLPAAQQQLLRQQGFPNNSEKIYILGNSDDHQKNNFVYLFADKSDKATSADAMPHTMPYAPLSFFPIAQLFASLLSEWPNDGATTKPSAVRLMFFEAPAHPQSCKNCIYGLGFGLYEFIDFKKNRKPASTIFYIDQESFALEKLEKNEWQEIISLVVANHFCRQLINLPPNHLGPSEFAGFFKNIIDSISTASKPTTTTIIGEELRRNFPLIATVGQGAMQSSADGENRAPRLLELQWGDPSHKKLCLVGKGVCFDSGGLNLKSASGMWLMKKDMAGAAIALGLAALIISNNLPYRLHLLLPLAENMPDGNSYRPSDILTARNGVRIEVGDTDAEGRLLLADALSYGAEQQPDMMIDFSTLTGAARVAVGTGISAFFCNDNNTSNHIMASGAAWNDYMWPLPLHKPYQSLLSSHHADVSSTGDDHYAGAITAALFLQKFVAEKARWIHIDTMAWNLSGSVGNPVGGAAMSLLACYQLLKKQL